MYNWENGELVPGTVVRAHSAEFYDCKNDGRLNKRRMYVIVKEMPKYILGCRITSNLSKKNATIIQKDKYPFLYVDSKIDECIYRIPKSDIDSLKTFRIEPGTMEYFRRRLYQRIVLGFADGINEYNDMFVYDYLEDHVPQTNNIIVYPSDELQYKYYYIYDTLDDDYELVELSKKSLGVFCVTGSNTIIKPKNIRFYTYYTDHNITRDEVSKSLNNDVVKTLRFPKK